MCTLIMFVATLFTIAKTWKQYILYVYVHIQWNITQPAVAVGCTISNWWKLNQFGHNKKKKKKLNLKWFDLTIHREWSLVSIALKNLITTVKIGLQKGCTSIYINGRGKDRVHSTLGQWLSPRATSGSSETREPSTPWHPPTLAPALPGPSAW